MNDRHEAFKRLFRADQTMRDARERHTITYADAEPILPSDFAEIFFKQIDNRLQREQQERDLRQAETDRNRACLDEVTRRMIETPMTPRAQELALAAANSLSSLCGNASTGKPPAVGGYYAPWEGDDVPPF